MSFEVRGTKENPFHLSIGAVVEDGNKYALIQKPGGYFNLPRETIFSNESIEGALKRGMQEELGVDVEVLRFLGGLETSFNKDDGAKINKTVVYFLCKKINDLECNPEEDEIDDKIFWLDKKTVENNLKESGNPELLILKRGI